MVPVRMSTVRAALGASLLLSILLPAVAFAHAELETAVPAPGAALETAPEEVVLTFNGPLVVGRSFFLLRLDGADVGRGEVDPADPRTMRLPVSVLAPGEYEVRWTGIADDSHAEIKRDTFMFRVLEPPPSPTPAPTAPPTAAPSAPPTPTAPPIAPPSAVPAPPADPTGAGSAGADVLIPIVAAAVVVGGLGAWLLRRGRTA